MDENQVGGGIAEEAVEPTEVPAAEEAAESAEETE